MPNGILFVLKSSQHTQTDKARATKFSQHTQTDKTPAAAGGDGVAGLWTPPMWAVCAIAALLLAIYLA